MTMKKLMLMSMLCYLFFAGGSSALVGSADAATSFSDTLKGYSGNTYANPTILAGSGLEASNPCTAATNWELIGFDATGAMFGGCGYQVGGNAQLDI
jgi:hypothetical protein